MPTFLYSNNQPLSEGLDSLYSSILHTFASYDCKLPEKSRDLRGAENMVRDKAGAGGMDTWERSERETKLAKVQPHVSFVFKFLPVFYWPENKSTLFTMAFNPLGIPPHPLPLPGHCSEAALVLF